ncbi:hypothetical protein Syun_003240 [Stephania yunnanensis]|uniref:Uncharacterized protein n=1 Tax=Stephania yunnanensis TaxID=152371 RepID=A0AAP0Q013_9MAGN
MSATCPRPCNKLQQPPDHPRRTSHEPNSKFGILSLPGTVLFFFSALPKLPPPFLILFYFSFFFCVLSWEAKTSNLGKTTRKDFGGARLNS